MSANPVGTGKDSKGRVFALTRNKLTDTYGVYQLCENYDGKVRGGIRKTWRYIIKDVDYATARQLWNKKTSK